MTPSTDDRSMMTEREKGREKNNKTGNNGVINVTSNEKCLF